MLNRYEKIIAITVKLKTLHIYDLDMMEMGEYTERLRDQSSSTLGDIMIDKVLTNKWLIGGGWYGIGVYSVLQ